MATLRHPIHLAKSAASLDLISNQRLLLGMATGDRAFEFPAFKVDESALTERYQTTIQSLRALWQSHSPNISNSIFELYEDSGYKYCLNIIRFRCLVQATQDNPCPGYNSIWMAGYFTPNLFKIKEIS